MDGEPKDKLDLIGDYPSVEDIVATIDDPDGIFSDGRFVREISEMIDLIDGERMEQGIGPYSYNQRVVFVHEAYRVAVRYKDKRRKGKNMAGDGSERGDLVFYDHLVGSTKILVSEIGLTGLGSVIAMLNHDTVEDFVDKTLSPPEKRPLERDLYKSLIDVNFYRDKLRNFDSAAVVKVFDEVKLIVEGVTKVRKATKEKELDATVAQLLNVTRISIRSVLVKLADRLHNLRTLAGHGNDARGKAKQREIIDATESVYLPLARIAGVQNIVREYVDIIVQHKNPELSKAFDELQKKRLRDRLDPYKSKIETEMLASPEVKGVEFIPRSLAYYTAKIDGPLQNVTIEDLKIGQLDPMFDLVITTVDNNRVEPQQMALPPLSAEMRTRADEVEHSKMLAMQAALLRFQALAGFGHGVAFNYESSHDPRMIQGFDANLFNNQFGGHLHLRVNDFAKESRLKRGLAAELEEGAPPSYMRAMITDLLSKTLANDTGADGIVEGARLEFLRPRLKVYTPDNEAKYLPVGATVADFAAAVHGKLLVGFQRAWVKDGVNSDAEEIPVSAHDLLQQGKVYIIDSCLSGDEVDPSLIKARPSWLCSCQGNARGQLRKALAHPYCPDGVSREELIKEAGKEYLAECCELLGMKEREIMYLLFRLEKDELPKNAEGKVQRRAQIARRNRVLSALGRADSVKNPLRVFAKHCDVYINKQQKREALFAAKKVERKEERLIWEVKIDAPHEPQQLKKIVTEFSRGVAVNIDRVVTRNLSDGGARVTMQFDLEGQGIATFDFFQMLMRLKQIYAKTWISKNLCMEAKAPSRRTLEQKYKMVDERVRAAESRFHRAAAEGVALIRTRDRLARAIAKRDPDLAKRLGIELEGSMSLVDPEVLKLRLALAEESVQASRDRLAAVVRDIMVSDSALAVELGLDVVEGEEEKGGEE